MDRLADGTNVLDQLVGQVADEALRARLVREIDLLRGARRFGLVFEQHLPESVRLPDHPIRKGVKVGLRDESATDLWRVLGFTDSSRSVAVLDGDGRERPVSELVVVREFGEAVFPGLRSVERIRNGPDEAPWHTVVNGENFHALQALRSTHREKVDLIYIDPPYNTGNEGWIYNDRYVDANDRAKSSKWLSYMERRLLLARDLLKQTGVIIVAIGDEEHHRLRMLLDQVFEPQNFLSDVVWQGGRKNDSRYISNGADYMLVYAKDESTLASEGVRWREKKPGVDEALEMARQIWVDVEGDHAEATKRWRSWLRDFKKRGNVSDSVTRFSSLSPSGRPIRTDGNLRSPNPRPNLQYDLPHPVTGKPVRMHPNGWRYSKETMQDRIARELIYFGADETSGAAEIVYLDQMDEQVAESVFVRDRNPSGNRLAEILGDRRFPNPKDVDVLMRWIGIAARNDALVLDFFGGSGTTMEAVMRLNAEDGGTRQCVLVTNNEVGSKQAKALRKAGHHPGDPEWENLGVFQYVTRPRISTVVTGTRPDGSTYSNGLPANVEMFDLAYLDPGTVRRGREFGTIAPLLWLEAGGVGERIDEVSEEGWALTDAYGVLFSIDMLTPFSAAVAEAAKKETPPNVVFVVTDSPVEYQTAAERLPVGIETVRLYQDYLSNYTINVAGGTR